MATFVIYSVAGNFVCLILGVTAAVWIVLGVGEVELLVLMWGTLFLGLPQIGMLYVGFKRREYLRDILGPCWRIDTVPASKNRPRRVGGAC